MSAALFLTACGSSGNKEKFAYVERPVETLYSQAATALERKRYERAVALFEEVERQHPYSAWARRAMLMKAFAYYQGNDYEDAITALDQFIALHPGNKDAPYAYYLKSICHYERIRDVGRDQEFTDKAVASLTDVIRRYPNTEYAIDARLKLDLTYDHLAGKEMYIGRFYLKNKKHIAAINRFKHVISNYQTTSQTPEALHRLVEAYLQLGVVEEARSAAAVLGNNYPGTKWYADSYKLFESQGLLLAEGPTGKSVLGTLEDSASDSDPVNALDQLDASPDADLIRPPSPESLEDLSPVEDFLDAPIDGVAEPSDPIF